MAQGGTRGVVDLVLLIDNTQSMKNVIDALKTNIIAFIDSMEGAGQTPGLVNWRACVVGYGDVSADGEKWFADNDFTSNREELKAQVEKLTLVGGGDADEDLLDALFMLLRRPEATVGAAPQAREWRSGSAGHRMIAVFTDAGAHEKCALPEAGGANADEILNQLIDRKVKLHLWMPPCNVADVLASGKGSVLNETTDLDAQTRSGEFTKLMERLAKTVTATIVTPLP